MISEIDNAGVFKCIRKKQLLNFYIQTTCLTMCGLYLYNQQQTSAYGEPIYVDSHFQDSIIDTFYARMILWHTEVTDNNSNMGSPVIGGIKYMSYFRGPTLGLSIYAFFVFMLFELNESIRWIFSTRPFQFAGKISFGVYLLHMRKR